MPSSKREVRNVVVISDTHIGDGLGLMTGPFRTDTGTTVHPSRLQAKVGAMWDEFWDWTRKSLKGEPFILVHNGDAIDGVHHRSTTQITHNVKDQIKLARQILSRPVERAAAYYHIRGTEAHVGPSAEHEEELAQQLGATPDADGNHARWELWLRLRGRLIHFLHHVGSTGSSAYEATAVHKELVESYVEAARWGDEPPDMIVRSHRHRAFEIRIPSKNISAQAIVTPAWQLKTPFTFKIPGARLSQPQIGGCIIRVSDDGILYTLHKTWRIERPKEVVV